MNLQLDGWALDQRRAIEIRNTDVLVSAGAGSGKTSVLVERVVSMIVGDSPIDLNRLLIVTFTEAAAGEMRERIAKRIGELRHQSEQSGEDAAAAHLKRQQSLIDQAQISTLHSFCLDIVRRNFFSLGLEPSFSILSEDEGMLLKVSILRTLLEERLEEDETGAFVEMIRRFRVTQPERLQRLVFRLDEFARSQQDPKIWLNQIAEHFQHAGQTHFSNVAFAKPFLQWVLRQLDTALQLAEQGSQLAKGAEELEKYYDNLAEVQQALLSVREELMHTDGFDAVVPYFTALQGVLKKSVRGKEHPLKERVRDLRNGVKKELAEVTEVLLRGEAALLQDMADMTADVTTLLSFVTEFQSRAWEQKRRQSRLDFSDLEHLALTAIENAENGEQQRLRQSFAQVFVDEYQDTSPIQDALVNAVQNGHGNLFVVGDVKQSIYRFRMAEPQLFLDQRAKLAAAADGPSEQGSAIDLAANYRSRKQVVDTVNLMFSHLFSPSFGGIEYDERTEMKFGALYPETDFEEALAGPVELHLIERRSGTPADMEAEGVHAGQDGREGTGNAAAHDGSEESGQDDEDNVDLSNIEREALVMAERILDLMGENQEPQRQVYDTKQQAYRPLRYSDIVILMRSIKGRMNTVLDVFTNKGIPAYGATSSGFYGALEIQWLVSALAAVDNPRREVDFASLLRSPLAGFSDSDLAQIRLVRGGNYYEAVVAALKSDELNRDLRDRLKDFLKQFRTWRRHARQDKAYDVLKRIIDDTSVLYYLLGMPGGPTRKANLEALLDKAREFDSVSFDGIFGFVQRLRDSVKQELDVGEARTLGENEDVVRVMTIHQSKGLEFPVVFVADMGKTFYQSPEDKAFPLHRYYGFGPEFHDPVFQRRWKTLPSIALAEVNTSGFLEEEARVLYVALTRAKEKLILVGSQGNLEKIVTRAALSSATGGKPLSTSVLMNASTYLDWLLFVVFRHPVQQSLVQLVDPELHGILPPPAETTASLDVRVWNTDTGQPLPAAESASKETVDVINESIGFASETSHTDGFREWLQTLTPGAGADEHDAAVQSLFSSNSATSFLELQSFAPRRFFDAPGKVTATELRRLWASQFHPRETSTQGLGSAENLLDSPLLARADGSEPNPTRFSPTPRESGVAFHAAMQHIDLSIDVSLSSISTALDRLVAENKLSEEMRRAVHDEEVLAFLSSSLGRRLAGAKRVYREQPFFSRIQIPEGTSGRKDPSFVVVQGVIDCLAELDNGWLLIDYKTDRVTGSYADKQAQEYAAQVSTYVQVAREVCGTAAIWPYLYFVKADAAIEMETVDLRKLF